MIILYFFICVAVVVTFAIRLSDVADWFEKNTKMTGALVGFFLAAATSLPELMSGITSVVIGQEELAISSILGSNLFNYNIVAVTNLAFISFLTFNHLDKNTSKILRFILSIYIILTASLVITKVFNFNLFDIRVSIASLFIAILYIWSVFAIEESDEEEHDSYAPKNIVRKKIVHAIIYALILIVSSSLLARVVEEVMYAMNMSASLAGSVLLGASTSLPEFVGAITLMRKRQYTVAVSSVLSSNLFNFFVLVILDLATKNNILTYFTKDTFFLIGYGVVNTTVLLLTMRFYKVRNKFMYAIPSVIVVGVYAIYLLNT